MNVCMYACMYNIYIYIYIYVCMLTIYIYIHVFTNTLPCFQLMSKDRWSVWEVNDRYELLPSTKRMQHKQTNKLVKQ